MMLKTFGFAACITLAGGLSACSSTSNPSSTGSDGGGTVFQHVDSGSDDSGSVGNNNPDAGEAPIGQACTANSDCTDDAGATAFCSSQLFKAGPVFPTPICMNINCTVATGAGEIAFCGDGTGLCQPEGTSASVCFPLCTVSSAGAVDGCVGNDTCAVAGIATDSNNVPTVIGMCQPGCTANAQCPTGSTCDTFLGECLTTVTPPTEAFGSSCNPSTDTACVCVGPTGGTAGICSSLCTTGGPACPQPTAGDGGTADGGGALLPFVCSAQLGGSINASDAGITFTTQPAGLSGICFPSCDTNADCAGLGSTAVCTADPGAGTHKGICTFN